MKTEKIELSVDQITKLNKINSKAITLNSKKLELYVDAYDLAFNISKVSGFPITGIFDTYLKEIGYNVSRFLHRVATTEKFVSLWESRNQYSGMESKIALIGRRCFDKDGNIKTYIDVVAPVVIGNVEISPLTLSYKDFDGYVRNLLGLPKPTRNVIQAFENLLGEIFDIETLESCNSMLSEKLELLKDDQLQSLANEIKTEIIEPLELKADKAKNYLVNKYPEIAGKLIKVLEL